MAQNDTAKNGAHHESPERAANVGAQFIAPNSHDDHHGRDESRPYEDIPGFCRSTSMDDIRKHGHVLTPGRYVGAAEQEDDGEPFEEKMQGLSALVNGPAFIVGRKGTVGSLHWEDRAGELRVPDAERIVGVVI